MSQKITHYHSLFGGGVFAGLFVSVAAAVILSLTSSGSTLAAGSKSYDAANIQKVKEQFKDTKMTLEELSTLYHSTVNSIFGDYIETFTQAKDTDQISKRTAAPENDTICEATGDTMNIGTYCLYLRVDDLYQAYYDTLVYRQSTAIQEIGAILNGNSSQKVATDLYAARRSWIDREFTSSKKALDVALQGYSEMLTQYPLHLEYVNTMKLLVKYYDHLADIRKKVDTYPSRFQDVTTTDCN